MPPLQHIIRFICIITFVLLSGCTQNTTYSKQSLANDAKAFCDIHEAKHWKDITPSTSVKELNEIANSRARNAIKTSEFNNLLNEMNAIEFYRQMYPTAKSKIEKITGEVWNCEAYKDFYTVNTSRDSIISNKSEADIVITKAGEYLIQDKAVEITPTSLKAALQSDKHPRSKIIIKLNTGASDDLLGPLFQALAPLGIENVSVLSDE